jgi:hypothetical protein
VTDAAATDRGETRDGAASDDGAARDGAASGDGAARGGVNGERRAYAAFRNLSIHAASVLIPIPLQT